MMSLIRLSALILGGLALLGAALSAAAIAFAPPPTQLGVRAGRLAPCPPSPNCVSSQADLESQRLAPIALRGSAAQAHAAIRAILAAEPRTTILVDEPAYLHALVRTPTMRFPDDVEFAIDEAAGQIHFRSAARLGYSDVGVNRARMERLGALVEQALGGQ